MPQATPTAEQELAGLTGLTVVNVPAEFADDAMAAALEHINYCGVVLQAYSREDREQQDGETGRSLDDGLHTMVNDINQGYNVYVQLARGDEVIIGERGLLVTVLNPDRARTPEHYAFLHAKVDALLSEDAARWEELPPSSMPSFFWRDWAGRCSWDMTTSMLAAYLYSFRLDGDTAELSRMATCEHLRATEDEIRKAAKVLERDGFAVVDFDAWTARLS